jgi:hypothetical protein
LHAVLTGGVAAVNAQAELFVGVAGFEGSSFSGWGAPFSVSKVFSWESGCKAFEVCNESRSSGPLTVPFLSMVSSPMV